MRISNRESVAIASKAASAARKAAPGQMPETFTLVQEGNNTLIAEVYIRKGTFDIHLIETTVDGRSDDWRYTEPTVDALATALYHLADWDFYPEDKEVWEYVPKNVVSELPFGKGIEVEYHGKCFAALVIVDTRAARSCLHLMDENGHKAQLAFSNYGHTWVVRQIY